MQITLTRIQLDPDCTIGEIFVDGGRECWSCEDTERAADAPKVFGKTAIPRGTYEVVVTYSPHFARNLPLLVNVPGFEGVRIHPGNTAADTEGCLLPGNVRLPKGVGESRHAFEALYAKIQRALDVGETVTITIGGD